MVGLHLHDSTGDEDSAERKRLFRVLYAMDKQRVFLTGDPCNLYHFDSDLELWKSDVARHGANEVASSMQRLLAASDDMMMIWEEAYLKLCSARAVSAGPAYSSGQVASLLQLLREWNEHHPGLVDISSASTPPRKNGHGPERVLLTQSELEYCYHVTHVLVLRCDRERDSRAQAQLLVHARASLRLIVEMSNMGDGTAASPSQLVTARLASLGRMLRVYPIVAFLDLVAYHLDDIIPSGTRTRTRPQPTTGPSRGETQSDKADMDLFHAVLRILQRLRHADRPSTYLNSLHLGLYWATRVLDETRRASVTASQSTLDPSGPGIGLVSKSTDSGATCSATTCTSIMTSTLGSSWDALNLEPLASAQQQQQQQAELMFSGTSSEIMDVDMGVMAPPSAQVHVQTSPGFIAGPPELDSGDFGGVFGGVSGGVFGHMESWSALSSVDSVRDESGGGGGRTALKVTGRCGFHGFEDWQDAFR